MKLFRILKQICCVVIIWYPDLIQSQSFQQNNITTYPIPFTAQKLKAIDMNNDQKPDLMIMSNANETGFAIYYGNGDETFGQPDTYQKELNFVNFDIGDLNNDSYMDLVISSYWFNGFKVYHGNKEHQFTPVSSYDMSGHATGVTISDIDNNGSRDVLGITSGSGSPVTLHVFKNDKNGNLSRGGRYPTLLSGNLNSYIMDKNGDNLSDFIISTRDWLALFYQQTNGEFLLKYWPTNLASVTLGDVNNDKLPDLVNGYTTFDPGNEGDSITVRFGLPDTLFNKQRIKIATSGLKPGGMYLADLNNDSFTELIVLQLNNDGLVTDSIFVFRGLGNAGFKLSGVFKLPEAIKSLVISDLRKDSYPEIVAISDKSLMIIHNKGDLLTTTNSFETSEARIYPNPARKNLILDLTEIITSVRVLDIYGKIHYTSEYYRPLDMNVEILNPGVYFIQGYQKDKLSFVRKFIKL